MSRYSGIGRVVFVASTADTLPSTVGDSAYAALRVLAESPNSQSDRHVATPLWVAPTTATSALGKLRDAGVCPLAAQDR
jgi:hypothetical protein